MKKRKDSVGTKMWPGLMGWDQVDGEMFLHLSTWVHHSPDNNLILHQPLCWFIMDHQDKAWMLPKEPFPGGFLQLSILSAWLQSPSINPWGSWMPGLLQLSHLMGLKGFSQSSCYSVIKSQLCWSVNQVVQHWPCRAWYLWPQNVCKKRKGLEEII